MVLLAQDTTTAGRNRPRMYLRARGGHGPAENATVWKPDPSCCLRHAALLANESARTQCGRESTAALLPSGALWR